MGPYILNARKHAAFIVGWAAGLQYKPQYAGPCVLTVIDTANSLNYFASDWNALLHDFQFYNLFVYDPIHMYSNTVAIYEFCNV